MSVPLIFVSALLMAAYMFNTAQPYLTFTQALVLKAAPIVLLAVSAFASRNAKNPLFGRYGLWVGVGLLFCSAGDVFMDLQDIDKIYFLPGLGSFLVGHVFYIVAFSVGSSATSLSPKGIPLVIAAGGMFVFLLPSLPGDFLVPVAVYCTAIALMGTKALGRTSRQFAPIGVTLAAVGAASFIVSDSVLSYALFKAHAAARADFKLVVMLTYYGAQLLIALSAASSVSGAAMAKKD